MYHALSLNFVNVEMEREFRAEYSADSLAHLRLGLILGLILYALFGILDSQVIPDAANAARVIRYAVICPVIAGIIAFSYSPNFQKHRESAVAAMGIAAGIGIIVMVAIAKPPGSYLYYAGLFLCSTFYFTFLRLRYTTATFVGWFVFMLYELAALRLTDIPPGYFINNSGFLFAFNLTGMSACYALEKSRRSAFLQQRLIKHQNDKLQLVLAEIDERRRQAEDISRREPSTRMFNHRYFLTLAEFECSKYQRVGNDFCVIRVDVDDLHLIGDSSGADVVDQVIQGVARKIGEVVRTTDIPCRYKDAGFAILLPETDLEEASSFAKRLLRQIEKSTITTTRGPISTTVSVGISGIPTDGSVTIAALMDQADKAVELAKTSGRNQVQLWTAEIFRSAS